MHSSVWYTMLYNPTEHPPSNKYVPGWFHNCCCCWGFERWNERIVEVFIVGVAAAFLNDCSMALFRSMATDEDEEAALRTEDAIILFLLVVRVGDWKRGGWWIEIMRWNWLMCGWFRADFLFFCFSSFLSFCICERQIVWWVCFFKSAIFYAGTKMESWTWIDRWQIS